MKWYVAYPLAGLLTVFIASAFAVSFYAFQQHMSSVDNCAFVLGVVALAAFAGVFYSLGRDEA